MSEQRLYQVNYSSGTPSLEVVHASVPDPQDDEVLIKHTAIGINFQDYEYYRQIPANKSNLIIPKTKLGRVIKAIKKVVMGFSTTANNINPIVPGMEAVGTIAKLGKSVKDFKLGQRVGYCTIPYGAYSYYRTIKSNYVFAIPDQISDEAAATNLTKGMTAHYLMRRTFYVRPDMTILIHAGSSAVGQAMIRLAREYNAVVITTVGHNDKIHIVKNLGVKREHILNYNDDNWVKKVKEITNFKGVNVVYDCLGKQTVVNSINCLMSFGLMVIFGQITGSIAVIDPKLLTRKSLFLTMPHLQYYKQNNIELLLSSLEVFALIEKGVFSQKPAKIYSFKDIPQAINDIATRSHPGAKIIVL